MNPDEEPRRKKACHPFRCRLPKDSTFPVDNPISLVGTGFLSMALSILTMFRLTPMLLLFVMVYAHKGKYHTFFNYYAPVLTYVWIIVIALVLFVGGLIMACSKRIKKRCPLMIHPWALLLLYFDVFYWLSLSIYLNYVSFTEHEHQLILNLKLPIVYFVFIYIDIALFAVLYWIFATYFIMAQLTVIEKCF
ncbi:UNVERIFIED_CONTAM: hypothetical protein PYX00_002262 [Menopon gallinae]|uniref:NADH dehydrogenase subunit 6 n=1 Tax=Menopon gallinae TaxID=328185 RepID=A0AAW2IGF7_9NEOP